MAEGGGGGRLRHCLESRDVDRPKNETQGREQNANGCIKLTKTRIILIYNAKHVTCL